MSVPFLLWCNIAMRNAIGTSAAIGFPIALAGAVGYVVNGLAVKLPPHTLGFVYLPALLGIAAASILTAPLGANLAHSLPGDRLKKIFALLLLVMGTKMGLTTFNESIVPELRVVRHGRRRAPCARRQEDAAEPVLIPIPESWTNSPV